MNPKTRRKIGWGLSVLLSAFLVIVSAGGKFVEWEGKTEMFEKMGFSTDLMFKIGILVVVLALLFLVPRVGFLAAILLTGYLGGATVTHLRLGEPFLMPIVIGIAVWVALGLRRPEVFALAFRSANSPGSGAASDLPSAHPNG
jgi:hypothetical protein